MSQIQQLLLYQAKDSELLKIEQEIAGSEERKKFVQARSFMKKASEKLDQLEGKSQEILSHLDGLNARYAELAETLKDFEHLNELVEGGADLSFYQRNAAQIADQLKVLKSEINALINSAKETTEEYQTLKKKVLAMQKQQAEITAAYQQVKDSKQGAVDAINKELADIAKNIDAEVMRRYQMKRSERIFPIICEMKDGRCTKCGVQPPVADMEKMDGGTAGIECEGCHRFLYKA